MRLSRLLSLKCNRSGNVATLPIFLLCFMLCLANAERDFNVNDSQVPVIEPKDAPAYTQDPYVTELMRCQPAQSEIVLSLLLRKHNWNELSVAKCNHVQAKLSKFFAIPKEFITLDTAGKRELSIMHKLSMRKGGKGQKHAELQNRQLGRANFVIGCGPNYFSMGEPIAKQIGHQIKDGTIGALAEENFGLWFIWRKELKSRSQRKRRQSEGSGAEEEDYDYGEDDEEQPSEPVTVVPTAHAHRHHHGVSEQTDNAELSVSSTSPALRYDEGISKLESDISKTIENTKNIKVPILSVDDEEDATDDVVVEEVELQQLGVPAAPVIAASDNELVASRKQPGEDLQPLTTTTTGNIVEEVEAAKEGAAAEENAGIKQVDTANMAAVDLAETEHLATSTSQTTTNRNNNNNSNHYTPATPLLVEATFEAVEKSKTSTAATPHTTANAYSTLANAIDTDMVNTLTTTTTTATNVLSSSSAAATQSSSSSSSSASSSASVSPTTTTTTIATMPTTITTTSTATTTTQSQTPKTVDNEFESTSTWPITDVIDADMTATPRPTSQAEIESDNFDTDKNLENGAEAETETTTAAHAQHSPKLKGDAIDALEAASNDTSNSIAAILTSNELTTATATTTTATITTTTTTTTAEPLSSSTTELSTDYVEPRQENTTPIIKMRMPKLAVTSGKAFSYVVPMETFYDAEDQTNLRLELTDKDGHELKHTSWLQFNADKKELYGLPLDDTVSRWEYRLSATDSGNASVTETLEINVQQHRAVRIINHEINIAVRINEKLAHNIDWQLKLIRAVARTLDDETSSSLVVREIRQSPQEPQSASFIYFNETLPTSECPESELKRLVLRLDASRLNDLVQPLLGIKSITGQLIGACQKTELTKTKPTTQMAKNLPPMPRNQVDRVNASVGQLLVYKVPSDTFYDPNDNELTLTLKTKDHKDLSARNWMQFDSKNQEFFGIPKSGDIGTEEYLLIAEDSGGLSANDALVVVVSHSAKKDYAILFKAYLAIRHENFNAELQRKFVERIAQLHGDANTNQILVRSITPHHDLDGTIVNFYNTSLYKVHNRCPDKEMAAIRAVYQNPDLTPSASVKRALGSELNLTNFTVVPSGLCHYSDIDNIHNEHIPPRLKEPSLQPTFPDEYMATFILPAIIIVVMILLASIIACCLHRRRHKSGKMELGDEEERKSFRTKGIPVIFQDEFEEKPEIGNKSPVILKDEKPPLLPPSYNTSNMNGGDNDVDEYVPPPAVVLGGREVRGKSPATPSYRKPPPYVSP